MNTDVVPSKSRRFSGYVMLAAAAGVLYFVPYMRGNYYSQFKEATGLTNGQIGELASVFGIIGMISYLPSGFFADMFPARILVSLSLILSGLLVFWHSTMPSFTILLVIYGGLAITTLLIFWAAFLKALRLIADEKDQGKSYGGNEALRWFWRFIISSAGLAILSASVSVKSGFVNMLIFSGFVYIAVGILCFLIIPKESGSAHRGKQDNRKFKMSDIFKVARIPGAWLLTGAIFCAYLVYNCYVYLTPYFVDVMGMSPDVASAVSIVRTYIIAIGAVFLGGFLSDISAKSSSRSKVMVALFVAVILSFIPMFFIKGGGTPAATYLAVVLACLITFFITAFRGVYWALLGECGIGVSKTGMVVGIASVVAYSSDAFIFKVWGDILDKHPGIYGYQLIFASVVAVAIVGVILSVIIMVNAKANIAKLAEENDL